jgi:hypothetical protein
MEPLPTVFTQVFFRGAAPMVGWPEQFAIVTAYNPDGVSEEPAVNASADARLRATIETMGLQYFRLTGGSRDGAHQEPGWGFSLATPRSARDLSLSFRQLAFFWIESDRISLVDSRNGDSTDLGRWQDRWLGPELSP